MSDWILGDDPTRRTFTGDIDYWQKDQFVAHMFWTYGGVMDGADMDEMKIDVNEMLDGKEITSGFCKEVVQTGSRFYHAGKNDNRITQATDFDYFGSPQMVGTWAIYLYLTGWELTASPYHKGVYARHKNSTINLITVKRTEFIAWMEASAKTKSYIIDMERQTGNRVGKQNYLSVFKKTRDEVDPNDQDNNRRKELLKQFSVLDKLSLTVIKKLGKEHPAETIGQPHWGAGSAPTPITGMPLHGVAVSAPMPMITAIV
jgi:hypothetical protein